jgi:predicted glycoside hydrolase/deacetylase ChbG (UPF0249 family)
MLLINADDYGLTPAVSAGMINLFKKERLNSVSLLAGMPGTEYAIEQSHANPELSVGLHVNLTEGKPLVSGLKSITTPEGNFLSRSQLFLKCLTFQVNVQEIKQEINVQYNFLRDRGINIRHIDGHQHIHVFPGIFPIILALGKENKIRIRRPWPAVYSPHRKIQQGITKLLLTRLNFPANLCAYPEVSSLFDLPPELRSPEVYKKLVTKNTIELMVHPYAPDTQLLEIYGNPPEVIKASFLKTAQLEYEWMNSDLFPFRVKPLI